MTPITNINGFQITNVDVPFQWVNRHWSGITNATMPQIGAVSVLGTSKKVLADIDMTDVTGVGWIWPLAYQYELVDQYVIVGLRSKRTGRVFHQLRGRSSVR